MNIVKCRAKNDNNLPSQLFQKLFKEECLKEGRAIIQLQFINNIALGVVIK